MVSEKKKQTVKEVSGKIGDYKVIGILDMFKLPSGQLHEIRESLREVATIRMMKKRLMKLILEKSELKGVSKLSEYLQGEPAFLFSNTDPFKLARIIDKSKSSAPAKPGDISPKDIVIKAGPTPLPTGPVIGEFQRAKIPASVEGEKISIRQDTVIVKEGEAISSEVAGILSKLEIKPMEIGLNLLAAWEDGYIYEKDILFRDLQEYIDHINQAYSNAFNLAFNAGYVTKDNIRLLLSKAHSEAMSLADEANIITKHNAPKIIGKASAHAKALKDSFKIHETSGTENTQKPENESDAKEPEEKQKAETKEE